MKNKIITFKQTLFASPFLLIFSVLTIWAILFSAHSTALIFFALLLLFIPIHHKYYYIGKSVVLLGVVIFFIKNPLQPVKEINNEITRLAKQVPTLSTKEKIEIYGLNLIMGVAALPVYPEVARETLTLTIPNSKGQTRIFKSDFMLNSHEIKRELEKLYIELNEYGAGRKKHLLEKKISWPAEVYKQQFSPEARVALALNPCILTIEANYIGESLWQIEVSCLVEVSYPEQSYVTILESPQLRVEEGLFYQLQKSGWLHPYKAEWQHNFIKDFNNE